MMATIVVRIRKTGEALRYSISDDWLPTILGWNKLDPQGDLMRPWPPNIFSNPNRRRRARR
jgi:hypothetical protein